MYHPSLRAGAQRQLKKIGQADIVIGLPSYKNPVKAAHVAKIAVAGAKLHYPNLRTVLINADAGHSAETRRAVKQQLSTNNSNVSIVSGRYEGVRGHGSAIAAVLDAALALDAKAVVILDSNTATITPDWIAGLTHLVLEGQADLVLPRYKWSVSDPAGMFNDLVVYPLFRALWGHSVRQPAAPDFALSPRLATAVLDEDVWETEVTTYGFAPWLTSYGILNGWRVAQSALGEKKNVSCGEKLGPPLEEIFKMQMHDSLTVLFRSMYEHRHTWLEVAKFYSQSTLTRFVSPMTNEPVPERDLAGLLDNLALGWIEYRQLWQAILTPENLQHLETIAALPPDRFYFPAELWARIIYDFAVVFNKGECDPHQVVASFYPIYQGRLAAFWQEVAGLSLVGREGTIAAQAVELEEMRSYLRIRWYTYQPWLFDKKNTN